MEEATTMEGIIKIKNVGRKKRRRSRAWDGGKDEKGQGVMDQVEESDEETRRC